MPRYAKQTTVGVAATQTEIERVLARYGASKFIRGWDENGATVAFSLGSRMIRFTLPLPALGEFRYARVNQHASVTERTKAQQEKAWEQACRQRWRALLLIIKAKLEAVDAGVVTLEDEFLAQTMLADGSTVGEWAGPQIDEVYRTGGMPALLPGSAPKSLTSGTR